MIKFNTSRHGELEVSEDQVITLPKGLIGFPEFKRYVMIDTDEGPTHPFKWFQCLDDGAICFAVMDPRLFRPDYEIEVTPDEVAEIGLDSADDCVTFVILTVPTRQDCITANMKAPVMVNLKNRQGMQVILKDQQYTTRHPLMDEIKRRDAMMMEEKGE